MITPSDPALALLPLMENDNLVRLWHFDPATQRNAPAYGWSLYDPQATFASANAVERVITGQIYWIRVNRDQTVTLNARERNLFAGWNPLTW